MGDVLLYLLLWPAFFLFWGTVIALWEKVEAEIRADERQRIAKETDHVA